MTIADRASPRDRAAARATIASPSAGEPMLIDRLMPAYDALRAEHWIVPGDIATVYAATRRADFKTRCPLPSPSRCATPRPTTSTGTS